MLAAAFKEQRDVEGDNRDPPGAAKPEKPFFAGFHHRVNDPFEPRESLGIRKDTLAEKRAIDPTFFRANAGKFGGDRLHRRPARRQQSMHHPIGIEEWDAEPSQRLCCSAFAHADRAGEAENDHRTGANVASIAVRSRSVT
jgi:hypothetical protein